MNRLVRYAAIFLLFSLLALSFSSCGTSYKTGDTTVLLTVGGMEVTHEHYRYVCMKNAVLLADGDEDYFTGEDAEERLAELEELVQRELRLYFAVESLAKKYKVKLSRSDRNQIKDEIADMRGSVSEEEYDAYFESAYMTENLFYRQTKNYYLERNVFYHIFNEQGQEMTDDEVKKDVEEHFMAASQILISKNDEDGESLAYELKERIEAGEDFTALANAYSIDSVKETRYFSEGEMQDYFENTVKSLEIGEIGVVKSNKGYHVIRREAIESDYVEENMEAFRDTNMVRIYNLMLEEEAQTLKIVYTDAYTGLIRE